MPRRLTDEVGHLPESYGCSYSRASASPCRSSRSTYKEIHDVLQLGGREPADRVARRFVSVYRATLELEPHGDLGPDGIPEPLQFELNHGLRIMLIPRVGFGWVIGDRAVAPTDQSECQLVVTCSDEPELGTFIERARAAGAEIVCEPAQQPWGYIGVFADPDGHLWMVRSDTRSSTPATAVF